MKHLCMIDHTCLNCIFWFPYEYDLNVFELHQGHEDLSMGDTNDWKTLWMEEMQVICISIEKQKKMYQLLIRITVIDQEC